MFTASQIRQDLKQFWWQLTLKTFMDIMFRLYNEISQILGLDMEHQVIIIGAGNLGQALATLIQLLKNKDLLSEECLMFVKLKRKTNQEYSDSDDG